MAEKILSKTQSEASEFISVRRSIVKRGGENNILAVQLHNGSDFIVSGVSLRVEFLDRAGGTVHEAKEVSVDGLMGLPGTDFILPDIEMPSSREAADVKLYSVTSGDYFYRVSNDGKTVESEARAKRQSRGAAEDYKATGKVRKKFKIVYAIFIVALFVLSIAVGFSGYIGGSLSDAGNNTEIVREIGDQDVKTRETC